MKQRLEQVSGRHVPRETIDKLEAFVALLTDENRCQNLVSASTMASIWERHILDSAQLVRFDSQEETSWVDIGSGAGLPGIVIACMVGRPVTLVEPRRLRADFLHKVVQVLEVDANIVCGRAECLEGKFDTITARAVAPLGRMFELSHHLSTGNSTWILPKGRNAQSELAEAKRAWQGVFHVEQSLTDPDSRIVVARRVKARRKL
jgi:16S rRNA (guanine527-N7)-methyltransferase